MEVNTEGLVRGVSYDTEPDKIYLVLIDGESECQKFRDWEILEGRQKAYDYIMNLLKSNYAEIDIHESRIIVSSEKVKVTDGISIYEFMKVMKEKDKVIDYSSFDIEDYVNGDVEGE